MEGDEPMEAAPSATRARVPPCFLLLEERSLGVVADDTTVVGH